MANLQNLTQTDLSALSIEELEATLQDLGAARDRLQEQAAQIHAVLDQKLTLKRATEVLGPDALEALGLKAHAVEGAGAVGSAEAFGKPGN